MFSKKATKIDEIFTVNLTVTTYYQIDFEDFVNFCGESRNLFGQVADFTINPAQKSQRIMN